MPSVVRDILLEDLNCILDIDTYKDYAPNGLQVEGDSEIQTICTAVTASQSVIDSAILHGAQALVVHHGYFWSGEPPILKGIKRQRIANILEHNINLIAYHLPLDCHKEFGNNRGLGESLNIQNMQTVTANKIPNLLWYGELPKPSSVLDVQELISKRLQREPTVIEGSKRVIKRIAWCTGAAQDCIEQAVELGVDAFISGEISERTYYQAMEYGIAYFAAGHHATERFGVQRLGQYIEDKFKLRNIFIDSNNPV